MEADEHLNSADDTATFALPLEDDDLLKLLKRPIEESEKYWDSTFGLDKVRKENTNLWLPNHWKNKDVYDYQEEYLYQDNRIFTSVETVCSIVNARIPQPEVMPAQEGVISLQIAKDLQTTLFAWADRFRVSDIMRIGTRNLLLKRVGYIKLRWDPNVGEHGEIVPEHVLPEDIVVDQDARWGDVPRFIAQRIRNKTGEELISMFPEARNKIGEMLGANGVNKTGDKIIYKTQLGKKNNIWEVWFRFYDEKKKRYSGGLAFCNENFSIVLSKDKNPNWNYEEESKEAVSNLLDFPAPPFFPINYLNDGTSYVDLTSMVEQAAPLQKILDRRGFQIMENAEQSGGGIVFNTNMLTMEEMAKLSGSPDERMGVKGDVRQAMTRVQPPPLPNYVIEDKNDARNEIDNIFATHDVSRGERSKNVTLGQDQMQQQQDYTRMDDIARAIERTAANFYRYVVQMMKVYYTEDHWFKATGEDGQFDFVVMKSDMIEDGVDVKVEAGSTLPVNKRNQQQNMTELAKMGLVDPLSLYEVLAGAAMPNPKKMVERFLTFKTDPASFLGQAKTDEFDRQAFMDIQILNKGEVPEPRDEITPEYLKFINEYMVGGEFEKQPDVVKALYVEWLKICQEQAQKQLQLLMSQAPTQDDMDATNQQAVEQAQNEQAMMGGKPAGPAGGPNELADKMAGAKSSSPVM